ncbi:MAG: TerB family tellurite resistance protein [Gammaproteobacteria bacterium]|nr:TerB family tellurite resistance protein [Gammaproteobacteria bacterium]
MLKRIKDFFDERLSPETAGTDEDSEHVLRLATGALLLEMVYMDGELRPEQCEAVKAQLLLHFGLDEKEAAKLVELAEAERADATDYFQFTSLVNNNYAQEQKIALVERLWRIAYANESLHMYEEHLVRKVAELLYVPHSAFIAAKLRASGDH